MALLSKGDTGTKVRELQHRLHQLAWFSGAITGNYGQTTVEAVRGFQAKRKLHATGAVDSATWTTLVTMTRKPTADELNNKLTAGPALMKLGSSGDRVRGLQARLRQIGWYEGKVTGLLRLGRPSHRSPASRAAGDFRSPGRLISGPGIA